MSICFDRAFSFTAFFSTPYEIRLGAEHTYRFSNISSPV